MEGKSRKNVILSNEDGDYLLTLMKPSSTEHKNKIIVLYEDAYGDVSTNVMTTKAIMNNYGVTQEELNYVLDQIEYEISYEGKNKQ